MENKFPISEATLSDFEPLATLVNSAYRGESSRSGWTTEADFLAGQRTDPEALRALCAAPDRKILCWRSADAKAIYGCVFLERFHDDRGVGCYLGMLTVSPKLQGQGAGSILMNFAEDLARQWGAKRVTLNVIQLRVPLMDWYRRRGYRETGETKPFPYGDSRSGIPLRGDLHFVSFEKVVSP